MEHTDIELPIDFIEKMKKLLGEQWEEFWHCYRENKYRALRFNSLKKGLRPEKYEEILKKQGISKAVSVEWEKQGYYYEENARPGKHPYHEAGLFYIQEPSAMSAAAVLGPKGGERVLDLCAAPGGKSTQLASYLGGEGLLMVNEIHPVRCKALSQNIERMGIANAIVTNEDSETLSERFPGYFDKILVDAPCSGEGMFRKNPEAAEEWSAEQVLVCAERQQFILDNAAVMLKDGGTMVYSTCTFSPEENEGVIGEFLKRHRNFQVEERELPYFDRGNPDWGDGNKQLSDTFRLFPHHLHGEGHFVAVLKKESFVQGQNVLQEENGKKKEKSSRDKSWNDKKLLPVLQEFMEEVLSKDMESYILSGKPVLFGEQLYRLPEGAPSLDGLRVLRAGLHIGTFKKNRFEPSHAFALFLGTEDVKNFVSFDAEDERTAAYLRGEAIETDGKKGWCLVCVDGFSLGWGKMAGGQMKNHYPKGLRKL